ncbi:DUF6270 domain-containing protein [Oceanobacillus sp. FSL W8-0428]|uniref:DUF6270 domain-containing protein n=1 Tax=Oceanobacillus sp. FSL W8-0428 TaxID=2921715 RepID=UPI0030F81E80
MKKIRISTIGSCITRDNFNRKFNPNYNLFFDLVAHQHQSSLVSVMSQPLQYIEDEYIKDFSPFHQQHIRSECDKSFLEDIKQKQPEYLIMDFDADVHWGVIEVSDNRYVTNNPRFKRIEFLKDYKKKIKIEFNTDEFFALWKSNIDDFFIFMNEYVPDCKIIIVKARFCDYFDNGDSYSEWRKKRNIPIMNIDQMNALWDKLDNYVVDHYHVYMIDMTEKTYYLNPKHPWGMNYLHFHMNFYNDFLNKFQEIIFSDKLQEIDDLNNTVKKQNTEIEVLSDKIKDQEKQKEEIAPLKERVNNLLDENNTLKSESIFTIVKRKFKA